MSAPHTSRPSVDTPIALQIPKALALEIEQAALDRAVDVPCLLIDALQSYRAERRRLLLAKLRPANAADRSTDEDIETFVDEVRTENDLARRR